MAKYNRIFSRPEALSEIAPARLTALLAPHKTELAACGFALPDNGAALDLNQLSHVLMSPEELPSPPPIELVEALYIIADFGNVEALDLLLAAIDRKGMKVPRAADQAVLDVAVDAWLTNKECVLEAHLELYAQRRRSFQYLRRAKGFHVPIALTAARIASIRPMLNAAFDKHHLALNPGITPYDRGEMIQFLVRRGDPLQRIGAFSKRKSCEVLNPERFDVVVYDKTRAELRVNVDAKWLTDAYRQAFGQLLYGSVNAFEKVDKFTLDVVRSSGKECLNCEDISGIEKITLVEIKLWAPGGGHDIIVRPDIYQYFESVGRQIPKTPKIAKVVFEVKFHDCNKPVRVSIYEPNRTSHLRDSHAQLIDLWLERRGFVVDPAQPTVRVGAEDDTVLVHASVVADVVGKLNRMGESAGRGTAVGEPIAS